MAISINNWKKVADPAVRWKGVKGGNRGTLSAPGGKDVPVAFIVDVDYEKREWIIWFQGLDDDDGPGEELERLPWLDANPWAFEAWCHQGRLKVAFKHYAEGGEKHREFGIYDTGYQFVP